VHYHWHPFHGCKLRLVKTAKIAGIDDLYCETSGGIVLGIPRWMTDPGRCAAMEVADLVIGLSALAELRGLLDGLKSP
jgi:hypothetical protein